MKSRRDPVQIRACDLRCEHRESPPAVEAPRPRLSWKLRDPRSGARERGYQIVVASSRALLDRPDLWDSGRVRGARRNVVAYGGRTLSSGQTCHWRVRAWDLENRPTPWSEPASWSMGLLRRSDWSARWIAAAPRLRRRGGGETACCHFRRSFAVTGPVRRARLYLAALGLAEPWLNRRRVTEDCLAPGWSDFRRRVQYVAYDVASALVPGQANALGFILAPGWYAGHLGPVAGDFRYGRHPALLAQLTIDYQDGGSAVVATDSRWLAAGGPVVSSHLYDGETYDARLDLGEWSSAGFDDRAWTRAAAFRGARPAAITAKRCTGVRRQESLAAVALARAPNGEWIFDFGQNLAGWARLRIRAGRGREIVLRFGEMLQRDGNLYVANLGSAKATDRYIARGEGEEVWEPRFTYHGFRYVALSGIESRPAREAVAAVVLQTTMPVAGAFACSLPALNRLQRNIVWGQRGNFLEVPTDCPQRDERLGWTGDAQVFFRTAAFNRGLGAFFEKWLDDLSDSQRPNGAFPDVAPDILPAEGNAGNAAWADAGVLCPWGLYVETGDDSILLRHYRAMRRWIEFQERTARNGLRPDTRYGDWLATDAVTPGTAPTPSSLIGTAYFARTAELLARIARRIGKRRDALAWRGLHRRVVRSFQREFVSPAGRVVGDTQTGYCLALAFDLLPARMRPAAVGHLVRRVVDRGYHLSTGFVGTPLLCPVLTRFGRNDIAARLIRQQTYPSWLYPVGLGATTMWERWNSYTREGGFGDPAMNSFNHYAYGAIGEWLYGTLGGIAPVESHPGYAVVRCAPRPCAGVTWARAWHETPRGRISVRWNLSPRRHFSIEIIVPPDTAVEAVLPGASLAWIRSQVADRAAGARALRSVREGVALRLASGRHGFSYRIAGGPGRRSDPPATP